jgi:DNA modification methylase
MQSFIPPDSAQCLRVLPTAFQAVPPAVARAAIEAHTQPGDVILDPFASGLGVLQAALDLDRKVIAASFNPINALALRATL